MEGNEVPRERPVIEQATRETWIQVAREGGVLRLNIDGRMAFVRPKIEGKEVVFYMKVVKRYSVAHLRDSEQEEAAQEEKTKSQKLLLLEEQVKSPLDVSASAPAKGAEGGSDDNNKPAPGRAR